MPFDAPIAEEIWTAKYRFAPASGKGDDSFGETARRVAIAVAAAEKAELSAEWQARFEEALTDSRFIPAGRILAGAGTERAVTLFN